MKTVPGPYQISIIHHHVMVFQALRINQDLDIGFTFVVSIFLHLVMSFDNQCLKISEV